MPDPATGVPRPPQGPLGPDSRPEERDSKRYARRPYRPPEQGAVLESFQPRRLDRIMPGVILSLICFAYVSLRDTGFDWMRIWWLWIFIVVPLPLFFVLLRTERFSAGADWAAHKRDWVRTYELKAIKIEPTERSMELSLSDTSDRRLVADLKEIQRNRELWDLVYNGVLHSIHSRHVTTDLTADWVLQLPPPSMRP